MDRYLKVGIVVFSIILVSIFVIISVANSDGEKGTFCVAAFVKVLLTIAYYSKKSKTKVHAS